jgi:hypothetical protein
MKTLRRVVSIYDQYQIVQGQVCANIPQTAPVTLTLVADESSNTGMLMEALQDLQTDLQPLLALSAVKAS